MELVLDHAAVAEHNYEDVSESLSHPSAALARHSRFAQVELAQLQRYRDSELRAAASHAEAV